MMSPQPALIIKMRTLYPSLPKSEQKVIDFICKEKSNIIHLSVSDFAEQCKVSEATVIRTCRSAGLSGYQEMKVTLARDLVTPLQSINEEITSSDDDAAIVEKVFQSTLHTLTYTRSILKIEELEKAVNALMKAKRIVIAGLGNSRAIALDFQHKLIRLGLDACVYQDSHIETISCSFLTPNDCFVAISHSGSTKDVVDSAKMAKQQGAVVISLTNIGKSPLTKYADIQLHTASNETRYKIAAIDSRVAQVVIIDCLYTMIAIKKPNAVQAFGKFELALHEKKC